MGDYSYFVLLRFHRLHLASRITVYRHSLPLRNRNNFTRKVEWLYTLGRPRDLESAMASTRTDCPYRWHQSFQTALMVLFATNSLHSTNIFHSLILLSWMMSGGVGMLALMESLRPLVMSGKDGVEIRWIPICPLLWISPWHSKSTTNTC